MRVKYFPGATPLVHNPKGNWIDLYANENVTLKAGEVKAIPLGVAIELPIDTEAWIAPRSSTFKTWGITCANSIGIIDNSYCGDDDQLHFLALAHRDTEIKRGDKICQFRVINSMRHVDLDGWTEFNNKNRGGFGTTGVR